jgi:uncharacterized protein involved in exopolysaccharide biosynthesis
MEEKVKVQRETYVQFLRRVHEAELALDLETQQEDARVQVLNRAQPPVLPHRSRPALLVLGAAASLALALGVGALLELANPVLLTHEQVESLSGLPVLGSVARIP